MRLRQLFENSGRIVKGVNTTVDVGPDEIKTQAAKFGNTVDKDGYPPTHKKRVKGSSTNVLFNLGLGAQHESVDHSDTDQAVSQLKAALLSKKQQLQSAADGQVYDIIDKIMTGIAKANNISGKQLHDLWVKQYQQVPDAWIMKENFADGKKPGRKGLAKRSGVNTKASVSSLRKTAKNSSGEKQRMAHWLANMKAGRAKKK